MKVTVQKKLIALFKKYPEIKLVYFFGSRARNDAGPLSDHDFAVYADTRNPHALFRIRALLIAGISKILKTDAVDVVLLNTLDKPEMKYAIISEGKLLYEKKPFKMLVEPRIITEYCDFRFFLEKFSHSRV